MASKWADKAKELVLCTTESLVATARSEEFEGQRALLKSKGVEFLSWSGDQLSLRLKDLPKLVDDFFGREWVKVFCGEDRANHLGKRLDVHAVADFRSRFADFYSRVFNKHDPGIPLMSTADASSVFPFDQRYVLPDIEERQTIRKYAEFESGSEQLNNQALRVGSSESSRRESQQAAFSSRATTTYQQRHSIENWLVTTQRSVILGDTGSGKSALLRFVAVNLLRDSPRLPELMQKWAQYLPIWIPFALWTKKIADPATSLYSLSDLLRDWLHSWDEDDLWPLVEQVLEDQRLLLLVDGLDEWSNEQAAGVALHRLLVFIEQRGLPAIVTSKPRGFQRLGMQTAEWRVGNLSGFSVEQQRSLAELWFTHRVRAEMRDSKTSEHGVSRRAEVETVEFINELRASADLQDLATVPLLLSLLIAHRINKARLPQSRFAAYRSLIEHLLSVHPSSRRKAAFVPDSSSELSEADLLRIFAFVAFRVQETYSSGIIDESDASYEAQSFLRDGERFGFDLPDARRLAREVFDVGESASGLLVRKSQTEIAFYHRAFQEYLAGVHLASLSLNEQLRILSERCVEPQWREVILALFSETRRPDDIRQYVAQIRAKDFNAVERSAVVSLLSEVAFGDFNCSVSLARQLADESFREIELGDRMSKREPLLRHVLAGLRSARVSQLVQTKLRSWFPRRVRWMHADLFAEMAKWPRLPEVVECLIRGIHDEHTNAQRQAARSLADLAAGDNEISERIASLASRALDPKVRAAALEGLLRGWPGHEHLPTIVESARTSASPHLRLLGIVGKIKLQTQNDDDRKDLLYLANMAAGLDYWWRDLVVEGLNRGWPRSEEVRNICIGSFRARGRPGELEAKIAGPILLNGFSQDAAVAELLVEEIGKLHKSVSLLLHDREDWLSLSTSFRDHPLVVEALDQYLPHAGDHRIWDQVHGALVGRTPLAKNVLLGRLKGRGPRRFYIEALLEGWGMRDSDVAEALRQIAFSEPDGYAELGSFLPKVIEDQKVRRDQIMKGYSGRELDGRAQCILMGLGDPDEPQDESVSAQVAIDYAIRQQDESEYGSSYLRALAQLYPSDSRVREIAKRESLRPKGDHPAVASAYGHDDEIRRILIEMACPLPAPLRALIATHFREGASDDEFALGLLSGYDQDDDDQVLTEGSISYHMLLLNSGRAAEAAIEKLSRDIVCYGPDYEERRQAALAGLIVLRRLDTIKTIEEQPDYRNTRHCRVNVVGSPYPNIALQRFLLQNWGYVKECLGDDRWKHLAADFTEMGFALFWNSYCLLAYDYPEAREEALTFLAEHPIASSNVLQFIARARPQSDLLLEQCLQALREPERRWSYDRDATETATELLGAPYGGDSQVLERLLAEHKLPLAAEDTFDSRLIGALCVGWPESEALEEIFVAAKQFQPRLSDQTYLQLICVKSASEFVFAFLLELIRAGELNWYVQRLPLAIPVVQRLREDEEFVALLTGHLTKNPTQSDKASIPRLVASARGVSADLREWCWHEVAAQLEKVAFPQIGFDLLSRDLRPVVHSLLDVLETGLSVSQS